jgi:eukaryotic-like serine/threonine-protein kinase
MNANVVLFKMLVGNTINQYRLKQLLGTGGFGGVYLADEVVRDKVIRQVAVKVIVSDGTDRQLNELIAATTLRHSHLLEAYTAGDCELLGNEFIYLVMELAGDGLQKRLEKSQLSVAETEQLALEVANVLQFLHDIRKVHRDLKPANILRVGNAWKLSDLGLIRDMGVNSFSNTNNPIGTVAYMPPEMFQVNHTVTFGWDTWSLGITIVEALTGRIPYEGFQIITQLIPKVMNYDIKIPQLPAPFDVIVRGCLQKEYGQRWTAKQVLEALTPILVNISPNIIIPQVQIVAPPVVSPQFPRENLALENFSFETAQVTKFDAKNVQIQRSQKQGQQFVQDLGNGIKLEMVVIPAGSFLMGAANGEADASKDEYPQHSVNVPAFLIGKYPITQAQYQIITGKNPSHFKGDRRPVETVSWEDAEEFCKLLPSQKYRLPSEAEWEYACRAGTSTPFYFGGTIAPNLVNYDGNYPYADAPKGDYRASTTNVGDFPANGYGLYGMHGNVWEWCKDIWHENYKGAPTDGSAWLTDGNSQYHMLRGGSWYDNDRNCRSANRGRNNLWYHNIGFRVVFSLV